MDDDEADATIDGLTVVGVPYPVQNKGDTIHLRNYSFQVRPEYSMVISTACEYDGYLSTEYEGQRGAAGADEEEAENLIDEIEQVRRHQVLLRRLIAEEQ